MIKKNNENFKKINVRKRCGRFNIFVNESNTLVYKKSYWSKLTQNLQNKEIFEVYKDIIQNCDKIPIYGKHNKSGFNIESDGSYMSNYVDGIRLDELDLINDNKIFSLVCNQIKVLLENL